MHHFVICMAISLSHKWSWVYVHTHMYLHSHTQILLQHIYDQGILSEYSLVNTVTLIEV